MNSYIYVLLISTLLSLGDNVESNPALRRGSISDFAEADDMENEQIDRYNEENVSQHQDRDEIVEVEELSLPRSRLHNSKEHQSTNNSIIANAKLLKMPVGDVISNSNKEEYMKLKQKANQSGALKSLVYAILNSKPLEYLISWGKYIFGNTEQATGSSLLSLADKGGYTLSSLFTFLSSQNTTESNASWAQQIQVNPQVQAFSKRYANSLKVDQTILESQQKLAWIKGDCARLSISCKGRPKDIAEFLALVDAFRGELHHQYALISLILNGLPGTVDTLGIYTKEMLRPLQGAFKGLVSLSSRYTGTKVTLARIQMLSWLNALMDLDCGILQTLHSARFEALNENIYSGGSTDDTESSMGSRDGEEFIPSSDIE